MADRIISWNELASHKTRDDLWFAVHGKVYAVTPYLFDHPGGIDTLVESAGQDATEAFEDIGHSEDAREVLARYLVGTLEGHDESEANPTMKLERKLELVARPPVEALRPSSLSFKASNVVGIAAILFGSWAVLRLRGSAFYALPQLHLSSRVSRTTLSSTVTVLVSWTAVTAARFYQSLFSSLGHKTYPLHVKVQHATPARINNKPHAVLDPRCPVDLPISRIEQISHDSKKFVLDLPSQSDVIGLPIGQHVSIRAVINGATVMRSYTPTSSNRDRGRLELVIKSYDTGVLTGRYLNHLQVGDRMSIAGPRGAMRY